MDVRPTLPTTVTKRNGDTQPFNALKIVHTMKMLSWGLDTSALNLSVILDDILAGVATCVSSHRLQEFAATMISARSVYHPDYGRLAGRMLVANLHKTVTKSFVSWVETYGGPLRLDPAVVDAVETHGVALDRALVHWRDFDYAYISVNTLMHRCLLMNEGAVCERPQFMHMRVAIAIHGNDLPRVLETYDALSRRIYTHATPVLYNGGTSKRNFASCFLYQPDATSPQSLLRSVSELQALWLAEGGVGMSLGAVPANRSGAQAAPGILPLLRIYDANASFVANSGLRRPSAATVYLPVWHEEVATFVQCRTTRVPPTNRVAHLFPALWVPDLFMKRLRDDATWTLFNPVDVPELMGLFGDAFEQKYTEYEKNEDISRTKIQANVLFAVICHAQRESGTPFILYQEPVNRKNNQSHLGPVCSSNLCTEIVQYSSNKAPAVCTLASLALTRFVSDDGTFDFPGLHSATKLVVANLDRLVDRAHYPTSATRESALRSRALGVGVQGFHDAVYMLGMAYVSPEVRAFNREVFETLYHACLEASCELAEQKGPYPAWEGSPASNGTLQIDMWPSVPTSLYDFRTLRERIRRHGLRNAMLTAQMPTASTAHVLGNSESTDPRISNVTTHRIGSGEYTEICPWLVRELGQRGLWTESIRASILQRHGSIVHIEELPRTVRDVYKTSWEIDPKIIIDMAVDRAPFIDQSQSMSLTIEWPETDRMRELQLHAWMGGLKTGIYYLRCRPPTFPLHFGVPRKLPMFSYASDGDTEDSDSEGPPPLEPADTEIALSPDKEPDTPCASRDNSMPPLVDVEEDSDGKSQSACPDREIGDMWGSRQPKSYEPRIYQDARCSEPGEYLAVDALDGCNTHPAMETRDGSIASHYTHSALAAGAVRLPTSEERSTLAVNNERTSTCDEVTIGEKPGQDDGRMSPGDGQSSALERDAHALEGYRVYLSNGGPASVTGGRWTLSREGTTMVSATTSLNGVDCALASVGRPEIMPGSFFWRRPCSPACDGCDG